MVWTKYGAPPPLPSEVDFGAGTYRLVAEAERAVGRLAATIPGWELDVPFARATALRDTFRSSQWEHVEGAIEEFLSAVVPRRRRNARQDPMPAGFAVAARAVLAQEWAFGEVERTGRIDGLLLGQMNGVLMGHGPEVFPGQQRFWRQVPSSVVGPNPAQGSLTHMAPGANLQVMMSQFDAWHRDDLQMPLLVKIAIGYLALETTHPFAGGNGFVGRVYPGLALSAAGALPGQVLALAPWLEQHRERHHLLLCAAARGDRWEEWVRFVADGVRESCLRQLTFAGRARALREQLCEGLRKGVAYRIAQLLFGFPILNATHASALLQIPEGSASAALASLADHGILTPHGSHKYDRVYMCGRAVDLYSTSEPIVAAERLIPPH